MTTRSAPACFCPFRYVDDPICVGSMIVYVLNRFALKPYHVGGWLVHDYLNDLLCLPIFLPIILRLQSAMGIRRHHLPPTILELIHNWAVFSVLYYFVLPRLSAFTSVADPWNSVAYLVGGMAAYGFWKASYSVHSSIEFPLGNNPNGFLGARFVMCFWPHTSRKQRKPAP